MNWCFVKIFLVFCAVVLCACEAYSSEHDTPEQPQSETDEVYSDHEESNSGHDNEYYSEDDDIRKHHYHNHGHHSHHGHYHGSHYVVTTTPKPKPPTTESGPVPLPHPSPTTCPRYEEYHDCGSPCQVECANLGQVCNIQNVRCSDGCYCIPGYARLRSNGPCVPQFNCPQPYCSANEVWLDCYQAPACDRECTSLGKPCDTVGSSCNAGCFCRPGYARHPESGDCVPTKRCPPRPTPPRPTKPRPTPPRPTPPPPTSSPKCPYNENFKLCGWRCSEDCDSDKCKYDKRPCEKGCFCYPGYARVNNKCIPRTFCPKTCPKYERYLDCGNSCIESCVKNSSKCKACERSGCFCIEGYSRIDGVCQADNQCPNNQCGAHEVYSECGSACQDDCDETVVCTALCVVGCFCEKGYARVGGKCVPRSYCPKKCPKYERYLDCGNTCMESCYKNSGKCKECERSGCFCIEGYSRINGLCQPDSQCPNNQCTLHEVYLECGSACQDDCDQNKPCTDQCVQGCFCEDGYARINGVCVPRTKCQNCPLNEQYLECGNACIESCYEETSRCIPCASSGCFCVDGYSRIDGVCRPDSQCPNRQCPAHEEFLECGSACQDDCEPSDSCTEQCIRGCFCEADYARVDGKCVPRLECPVECPDNEHYEPCGNMCIEHCDRDLLDCSDACYPGCYCDEGYARIGEECLPRKKCNKCPLNEEFLTCGNGCQDLCDPSATQCSSECVKGCFCQPGYSRINGLCVPRSKCFKCGSGEQYYECSSDCLERCDRNVILCPPDCEEGCFCAPGFSRIKKQCLPTELCPKCGENEEYQDCGNHCLEECGNKQCPLDLACHAGCYCKNGYKRDGKKCVPENQCPPQCTNPNEVYSLCGNNCTDLCPDPNRLCTLECYNGCFCAEGYSRLDYNSPCIPTDQCPGQCSGENEQFYECGNDCFDSCPDPNLVCTLECTRGCFCQPNYVRLTPGGKCVPEWKCPNPCARPFEELNTCGNNCTELCPRPGRACEKNCWKGCFCKKGYYRASYNGLCIPESKCPSPPDCTGPNEEIRDCGSRCEDDCPGIIYECPLNCQVGCYCKPGFKRVDRDGECVFEGQCPPVCRKPNEAFTQCGSPCREECPYPDALCPDDCYLGCYCQDGYSRINGECVPTSQCPSICTDPYETYSDCGNRCSEQCNSEVCPAVCEVGCFCKPGYSRQDGKCIPKKKCPPKCNDPNEEYTNCGSECQEQCGPRDTACPYECNVGCFCKAGYSRNNSVCIETSQCPGQCADPNEIYTTCGNSCREKCGAKFCPAICETGCFCRPGYSRVQGVCVPKKSCPTCGENEVYTYCGSGCTDPCESRGKECKDACREGCFCKDDYSRVTPDTPCVPDSECPETCPNPNESYNECGNHCREQCNSGLCPTVCQTGCFCVPGFSRNLEGKCVPTKKCPPKCNDPNEEYTLCGNTCKEQCGNENVPCPLTCKAGCFCKAGYSRNGKVCIETAQCPVECKDPNEIYTTCGNSCREKCGAKFCPAVCETGCFCRPGYSRVQGICVPKKSCPTCGQNEVYTYCGSACTDPCETRGQNCLDACKEGCFCKDDYSRVTPDTSCVPDSECPVTCTDPNESYNECGNHCREQCNSGLCPTICQTGCFCNEGYSRNNGVCIETSLCPGQCADPNEIYTSCGNTCREKCGAKFCPAICETGCFCRPGYSRVQGVCVPKKSCPTCGENEVYTYCGSGCTDPCESRGKECKDACREGCFCKDDYSRVTPDTPCIPDSECPETCPNPNESYNECGNRCREQCNSGLCPTVCQTGCFCVPGFSRNLEGKCVPTKKCPPKCNDPNEEYTLCGNTCKEQCGNENVPCPLTCKAGCFCKAGYSRNNNVCIETAQCPVECKDPNEIYTTCGNSCREKCGAKFCPAICETGCFCRPGYSRVQGVCVPQTTCPTCGQNEVYTYCGSGCTDPCETRGQNCLDACREGCFCKDDYSRVTPDTPCVPDSECPPNVVCGRNEVYTDCGRDCQTTCDNMGVKCPIVHIICPSGCYCLPGYARIYEGGSCVEQDICPSSPCGDNEVWLECGEPKQPVPCPQNCQDVGKPCQEELPSCDPPVPGGCYCKPGFARAPLSERCVPISTCRSYRHRSPSGPRRDFLPYYL